MSSSSGVGNGAPGRGGRGGRGIGRGGLGDRGGVLEDLLPLRPGLHFVRTQKWHGSRYVKLKVRSANLVLIFDILLVCLGYAFYRTGGVILDIWM
jgi:hypothetical protein